VPGTDGRPFVYEADPQDGRVFLALEDGRVLNLRAGIRLSADPQGWLCAAVPDMPGLLRITELVNVRAVGHDEVQVSLAAQAITDARVVH
jgi:hypothetical protein